MAAVTGNGIEPNSLFLFPLRLLCSTAAPLLPPQPLPARGLRLRLPLARSRYSADRPLLKRRANPLRGELSDHLFAAWVFFSGVVEMKHRGPKPAGAELPCRGRFPH